MTTASSRAPAFMWRRTASSRRCDSAQEKTTYNYWCGSIPLRVDPERSGAARLAVIPAGASPVNTRSPVHVVVISSGSEGDQTAESLEVLCQEDAESVMLYER